MSMINTHLPDRYLHDPNKSDQENEIQELFIRQYKTAFSELVMTALNINTWRERSIQLIHQYADEQLRILHEEYHGAQQVFQRNLEETSETVQACREANTFDLFAQIRDECRQLKLQVAQLENAHLVMEFPRVITLEEKRRRDEQEKHNADKPANEVTTKQSEITVQNRLDDKPSTPFASHEEAERQSTAKSSAAINEDQNEICVVCFMIYPLNMTQQERCQHMHDHFPDE